MSERNVIAEVRNPEGHLVQLDDVAWNHVLEQHIEMSEYLAETMTVHVGPYEFDNVSYDSDGDVLYLRRGEPQKA